VLNPARIANVGSTACVFGLRDMLAYAAECGVNTRALLGELGIDQAVFADPDARVSVRLIQRAWELAATRSGDPTFGLHAAERAGIGVFEALDYALWASATLEDALDRLERFYRVIGDDLGVQRVRSGNLIRLRRVYAHDQRQRGEAMLAFVALRARELCGRSFRLREVRFSHHAPADLRPYRALFRCPVKFDCAAPELVFAAEQLQLPVRTSKPGLATVLDRHLAELLARLPRGQTLLSRVADSIARTLHVGPPSVAGTARALHMSPRTLQRQLKDLGVSHRKIVDDVRRNMAERLLSSHRVSISELGFMLGFEDVSGFRRAFRKWTGKSASFSRPT
jgi:AraC-like DNA-binding protein